MGTTDRRSQLLALNSDIRLTPLVEKMVMLEERLAELEALPWYRVNPKDPTQQKPTPAFYMYHKTLASYKEIVKLLIRGADDDGEEESPLRAYLKAKGGGA